MKKTALTVISAIVTALSASAQTTWIINNTTYRVDTLYHATVGPGTTETELRITSADGNATVNNIFYTVTDLNNPYLEMRAGKGGNHMRMLETVPDIAKRLTTDSEIYFAGVNADFFNTGYPYNSIGMCIANGQVTNFATPGADIDPYYITFDNDNYPTLATHITPSSSGTVTYPDGSTNNFQFNSYRGENQLRLYSPQWQYIDGYNNVMPVGHTGTNEWGSEVQVRPTNKKAIWGSSIELEVINTPTLPEKGNGNMAIPTDGYVLSGHGTSREAILKLNPGDKIRASIGMKADGTSVVAKELLGGFPIMLRNTTILTTPGYPEHLSNLEPRSAVGYNYERTKLVMLVCDGRKAGGSAGVTQRQLAEIMRNLGCASAMNFDGGGSSTMYVRNLGIKNVPSTSSLDKNRPEGTPRTVVNALFAVATAPADNEIASIELRDKKVALKTGEKYTPVLYGYNKYGVMVNADIKDFTLHVGNAMGTVSGTTLTAGSGSYSGDLSVMYNGVSYSVPLYINGGGAHISSSVEQIAADSDSNAPAEYYTPLGTRISNPTPGSVVIVRRGGKVTKETVR